MPKLLVRIYRSPLSNVQNNRTRLFHQNLNGPYTTASLVWWTAGRFGISSGRAWVEEVVAIGRAAATAFEGIDGWRAEDGLPAYDRSQMPVRSAARTRRTIMPAQKQARTEAEERFFENVENPKDPTPALRELCREFGRYLRKAAK